jgi:riboflavin synthase
VVSREPLPETPEAGASVCHSGVCLTVAAILEEGAALAYDVIPETLARTTLGELQPGHRVNVEPSLRMGDELGGHLVSGHVDAVGTVLGVDESDGYVVRLGIPPELALYFAPKGSVALDGISLTIVEAGDDFLSVALIPETLRRTTAGAWVEGHRVNVEIDTMARYAARLLGKL